MAERREFRRLLGEWRATAVLIATFGLTLFENLTVGILAGCGLAILFAVFKHGVPKEGA
jgi:SulP family sulfate permease